MNLVFPSFDTLLGLFHPNIQSTLGSLSQNQKYLGILIKTLHSILNKHQKPEAFVRVDSKCFEYNFAEQT